MTRNNEERQLEIHCCEYARKKKWACWKNEKNGNKGIPDYSFLSQQGRFILVEFKKNKAQKPRKEQVTWMDRFPSVVFLIGSFDDFVKLIDEG